MSANLHLTITVRGYDPNRVPDIKAAIEQLITGEGLELEFGPLHESADEKGPFLRSATDRARPVVLRRSQAWRPEMQKALRATVRRANGKVCQTEFESVDAADS